MTQNEIPQLDDRDTDESGEHIAAEAGAPETAPAARVTDSREREDVAYLVVREGTTWRDEFRLIPGQVTTIGRAPTNRVVLRDEICSRNHCEVFQSGDRWTLRDLGSRNGTQVNGVHVAGDTEIFEGDMIQIGPCDLGSHTTSRNRF